MSGSKNSGSELAVLTQNYPTRLRQAGDSEQITFRSGKAWTTAEDEVETHGSMEVYFRTVTEGDIERITHVGRITDILTHPEDHRESARRLRQHLPTDDTYLQHNDPPDTLYVVTDIAEVEEPFSQTELKKRDDTPVDENYRRGYAIVQRRATR